MALASLLLASVAIIALGNTAPAEYGITGHAGSAINLLPTSDARTAPCSGGAATHHQPASGSADTPVHDLLKEYHGLQHCYLHIKLLPEPSTKDMTIYSSSRTLLVSSSDL